MVGITERNQQKLEVTNAGFSLKYIDEWQPKTTLYRHKASYTAEGEISQDVGSTLKGVPGSPDYVLRKAKIGLFPWKPGDQCDCQWCKESFVKDETVAEDPVKERVIACDQCDFVPESEDKATASSQLRFHKTKEHK